MDNPTDRDITTITPDRTEQRLTQSLGTKSEESGNLRSENNKLLHDLTPKSPESPLSFSGNPQSRPDTMIENKKYLYYKQHKDGKQKASAAKIKEALHDLLKLEPPKKEAVRIPNEDLADLKVQSVKERSPGDSGAVQSDVMSSEDNFIIS